MSYEDNDMDYFAEYRLYRLPIRQFISGCLLQYLLEQKQVKSCYGLAIKFNQAMGMGEVCDSKYWNKISNGMVISSRHKINSIENFECGVTKLLRHPICQILNLPINYFVPCPISIFLKKPPVKLPKASNYMKESIHSFSNYRPSMYLETLDKLCQPVLESYDASRALNFKRTKQLKLEIDEYIFAAENQWRYPRTVLRLKKLIDTKLTRMNEINQAYSRRLG
jgi:hypothetical protein